MKITHWYISFATDTAFLGGTIVEAHDPEDAMAVATKLRLNPGGQAAILPVAPAAMGHPVTAALMNKLLSSEEINKFDTAVRRGDMNDDQRAIIEHHCVVMTEEENGPVRH